MPTRRDTLDRAGRIALAGGCMAVGVLAGQFALGAYLRVAQPAAALRLAPFDARILAQRAGELSQADVPDKAHYAAAAPLARLALRRDPTTVSAVQTLGFASALDGQTARSAALLRYAMMLSRRNLPIQLWAIETAVSRGQVGEALHHYDLALRTSRQAQDVLFPVLGAAIAETNLRTALARVLLSRPPWANALMGYLATAASNKPAAALLFAEMARSRYVFAEGVAAQLMSELVIAGHPQEAWTLYAALHPGARADALRDPRFGASVAAPSPFDWTPAVHDGIAAGLSSGPAGSMLDFQVSPGSAGEVVRQLQLLPPGTYRLQGIANDVSMQGGDELRWQLSCMGGSRNLGSVALIGGSRTFAGTLIVPPDCRAQWLTLVAQATESPEGIAGGISAVRLTRLR